jgi:hypothetical protein
MYATLNTGLVNRTLTTADLNVADSDSTGACGLRAAAVPAAPGGTMNPAASVALNSRPGATLPSSDPAQSLLIDLVAAEPPHGFAVSYQPAGAPSTAARDTVFAAILADGLSSSDSALLVAKSNSIYATQSVGEDDDALFEVPLFPDSDQNGQ